MKYEFVAQIVKKTDLGNHIFEITISHGEEFTFSPGQYVWIIVENERRAFTIASASRVSPTFSIIFRESESTYKQKLLNLHTGDPVSVLGPFGSAFKIDKNTDKTIVALAGGLGIAPFLSILKTLQPEDKCPFSHLIYTKSASDPYIHEEALQAITTAHSCEFLPLSTRLTRELLPSSIDFKTSIFFICGSQGFVDAMYTLLTECGVPFEHMHFEQFYPYRTATLTDKDFEPDKSQHNTMLQAVNESKNHVVITDINGQIIYANKTAEKNTGYTFDEMRGNTPRLWGSLMTPEFYKSFWKRKHEAGGFDGEITNRRKNGEEYTVIAHISPIMNDQNVVIGYIGTEEDITERIRMEKQILNQKNQLQFDKQKDEAMLESIGEGLVAHDQHEHVVLVNDPALNLLGFSREELIGKRFIEIIKAKDDNGDIIKEENRDIRRVFSSGKKSQNIHTYIKKDGSTFIAQVSNSPIVNNGKTIGVIQVIRDITHEKQIDKMKTEFISLASHQLRTPLSTINWYLELLLDGDVGDLSVKQKNFLKEAYQGSIRMTKLVNALLNVARIESGSFSIQPEPTDLVKLMRSVLDELKVQIDEKKHSVKLVKDTFPIIPLDPELFRIVVQNLLTNAIKYTPENGTIVVSLKSIAKNEAVSPTITTCEDSFLVQVADNGVGIPQKQQDKIFDKLFRADNVVTTDTEGTGLGLYILKSIVEHCNGEVWFDSKENKGTTFYVLLPLGGMQVKKGLKKLNY